MASYTMSHCALYGVWGGPSRWIDATALKELLDTNNTTNMAEVLVCSDSLSIVTYGVPKGGYKDCKIRRYDQYYYIKTYLAGLGDNYGDITLIDNIIQRNHEFAGLSYFVCGVTFNLNTRKISGISLVHPSCFQQYVGIISNAVSLVQPVDILHSRGGIWEKIRMSAADLRGLALKGYAETTSGHEWNSSPSTLILYSAETRTTLYRTAAIRPSPASTARVSYMIEDILKDAPEHIYIVGIVGNAVVSQPHIGHLLQMGSLIPAETAIMYLQEPANDNDLAYDDD